MDTQTLRAAFERAGVGCEAVVQKSSLTTADLFEVGLTGKPESAARRRALLRQLHLPERLSNSAMLTMLNTLLTREEFWEMAAVLQPDSE
ncbi:hypothetical protein SDC9_188182 [bioreactor metagenome]|uniref:Ribonuclease M5 C-terminal domain-containing protein n=1 Tax=bioreactor metagenome TaxID=1076179 RepID=A0A645HWS8_9ZZZZ